MMAKEEEGGVPLKCDGCGYQWTYKGKKEIFATCPDCRKLVNIVDNRRRKVA